MRTTIRLKLECARAVLAFCRRHPGSTGVAEEAEQRLSQLLAQADRLQEQQRVVREEMELARRARDELARSFKARSDVLLRIAGSVAEEQGIRELRLRRPGRVESPGTFLRIACVNIDTALTHQSLLLVAGMPGHMLEALGAELTALQQAHHRRSTSAAVYAAATADLEAIGREAMRVVRHLDALYRIRFLAAPERLAEWSAVVGGRWGREGEKASA
jgi:hypothetical protein